MSINTKYIFVTGGVTSSLGKGIIAASLAKLLQARGFTVTIQKLDPYINIDPGTLNPYEHGECYVTDDGAETDLDLGHYERFLNVATSQANNVTTGRIYQSVIDKERKGEFLGKTVQVIPHITDEIKNRIKILGKTGQFQFVITEIGGTVGDIESLPYIEAVRQLKWELGDDCTVIHLTLLPYLATSGELKTKPTQHSVKLLLEYGVQPDILVCRSEHAISNDIRRKIALFCNVSPDAVIEALDASTIYEVPLLMEKEKLDEIVLKKLNINTATEIQLEKWKQFLNKFHNPTKTTTIGLVGKYVELKDSYKSIAEAFIHAGAVNDCKDEECPFIYDVCKQIRDWILPDINRTTFRIEKMTKLIECEKGWKIIAEHELFEAQKILLCTGSKPKWLDLPKATIPLHLCLCKSQLEQHVSANDKVIVFGTAHSGTLVLKNLYEIGCKDVVGIYKGDKPFVYARDGILGGIKQESAQIADTILKHEWQERTPSLVINVTSGTGVARRNPLVSELLTLSLRALLAALE